MAKEKNIAIKQADITNNCPECYNQELMLTFLPKTHLQRIFSQDHKSGYP